MLDRERLGRDGFQLDTVDEGFSKGNVFDAREVEAVHVVPDCTISEAHHLQGVPTVDLLLFVILIFDTSEEKGGFVGEEETVRCLGRLAEDRSFSSPSTCLAQGGPCPA